MQMSCKENYKEVCMCSMFFFFCVLFVYWQERLEYGMNEILELLNHGRTTKAINPEVHKNAYSIHAAGLCT